MYCSRRIAVVIPAYNVEQQIESVIYSIPDFVDHIIVVNDCSKDGTARVLESINDQRLIRMTHQRNTSVGGAMKTGFKAALQCDADIIVKIDGDGQMDPRMIPLLLDPILNFDVDYTKGNRLLKGRHRQSMPLIRLLGNFALSFASKLASGYWHIFDPQNGYHAVLAGTLSDLDLDRIDDGYFYENSMLIELNCADALVMDVPMDSVYGEETSNMRLNSVLVRFPLKLLGGFCTRIWRKHLSQEITPAGVFFILGLPLVSFGCIFGLYQWISNNLAGLPTPAGTVMIGALAIIVGFQMLLQALLFDVSSSLRLSARAHRAALHRIREMQQDFLKASSTSHDEIQPFASLKKATK